MSKTRLTFHFQFIRFIAYKHNALRLYQQGGGISLYLTRQCLKTKSAQINIYLSIYMRIVSNNNTIKSEQDIDLESINGVSF